MLPGKWILELEGINLLVLALKLWVPPDELICSHWHIPAPLKENIKWLLDVGLHTLFPNLNRITLHGKYGEAAVGAAYLGEAIMPAEPQHEWEPDQ